MSAASVFPRKTVPERVNPSLHVNQQRMPGHTPMRTRMTAWTTLAAWLAVATLSTALRLAVPPYPIYGADNDDKLMVALARSILDGTWTAPWTDLRMCKGAGYPLFLAAIHPFGVPPTLAVHLLLLLGGTILMAILIRLKAGRGPAVVLFALLAFDPVFLGSSGSRIYRDPFIAAMVLNCFALIALTTSLLTSSRPRGQRSALVTMSATAAGVGSGWLSVTKPDTLIWFVPAAVGAALLPLFARDAWKVVLSASRKLLVAALVAAAIGLVGVVAGVSYLNNQYNGVFLTEDFGRGAFQAAWRALTSIDTGTVRRRVPITRAHREAAYGVSETARSLRPYLEGPPNTGWKADSCAASMICDESSAWFPWEFRQAAMSVLTARTPNEPVTAARFQALFRTIAEDIERACSDGRLPCLPGSPVVGLPAPRNMEPWSALRGGWQQFRNNLDLELVTKSETFPPTSRSNEALWVGTVAGVRAADRPATVPPEGAVWSIVGTLAALYRWGAWLALLPALGGMLVGFSIAPNIRGITVAGASCLATIVIHMAFLGLLSEEGGLYNELYPMDSHPLLLISLALGVTCAVRGAAALRDFLPAPMQRNPD